MTFLKTLKTLKSNNLHLHYLATWWDILDCAKKINKFDKETLAVVENFLNELEVWSQNNGGR